MSPPPSPTPQDWERNVPPQEWDIPEAAVRQLRVHMEHHPEAFDARCLERVSRTAALAAPRGSDVSSCQHWCIGAVALARSCVAADLLASSTRSCSIAVTP